MDLNVIQGPNRLRPQVRQPDEMASDILPSHPGMAEGVWVNKAPGSIGALSLLRRINIRAEKPGCYSLDGISALPNPPAPIKF
jgi:hypothetical protein